MLSRAVNSIKGEMMGEAMGKPQITVRLSPSLLMELNHYVEKTGTSKTDVVVSAIAQYLGCADSVPLRCISYRFITLLKISTHQK